MDAELAKIGEADGPVRKRRTLLADGRYLIYYTFGDEEDAPRAEDAGAAVRAEPAAAETVAGEEERLV